MCWCLSCFSCLSLLFFFWVYSSSSEVLPALQKYRYMHIDIMCDDRSRATYCTFLHFTVCQTAGAGRQASWSRDAPFEVRMSAGHEILGSPVVVELTVTAW